MISILLPTRGRPDGVRTCLETALDRAHRPDDLEVLVRYDDDDPELKRTLDVLNAIQAEYPRTFIDRVGGVRHGYKKLHLYWNELAAMSRGWWLLNWNDDCEMLTEGWDALVENHPHPAVQFIRRDIFDNADYTFPVTSRDVYEAMGHISGNAHADSWAWKVSEAAGCIYMRDDVMFRHHRLNDLTSAERDVNYDMETFNGAEQTAERARDAEKVRTLLRHA